MNGQGQDRFQWSRRVGPADVDAPFLRKYGDAYRAYREAWNRAGPGRVPDFPVHLDIEAADACNLRCRHCYRHPDVQAFMGIEEMNTGKRFPLDLLARILEEGRTWGLASINFGFSGECMVNKDLVRMVEMADRSGIIDIRTITNGLMLNEERIEAVLDSPLKIFSLSIDAGGAESYRALKGEDGFERLVELARFARARRDARRRDFPLIRASYYPSPETAGEEAAFIETFSEIVDFIDIQEFKDLTLAVRHHRRADCIAPYRRLAVFANGEVAPCCSFFAKKLIVGSLESSTLKQIWDGERLAEVRAGLESGRPGDVCAACLATIGME